MGQLHKILPTLYILRGKQAGRAFKENGGKMKQRIRVVGIVKNNEGVLVLKRNRGRSEAPVFWELPTGKINFGEQPEEAMVRSLEEYTGLKTSLIKLKDVVTFLAPEGSSQLSNLYIVYELTIPANLKPDPKDRYTAYKFIRENSNGVRLNEASMAVLAIEEEKIGEPSSGKEAARDTANSATVYVDGASRGNPGPAGIGYCIFGENGQVLKRGGEFVGFATSRVAEYYAFREGIEQAMEMGLKSVRFVSDNLMLVNQLNGIFKVKNQDIMPIYREVKEKLDQFEAVAVSHVPRAQNSAADKEANQAIDRILGK